jgi:hypothetical protein
MAYDDFVERYGLTKATELSGKELAKFLDRLTVTYATTYQPKRTRVRAIKKSKKRQLAIVRRQAIDINSNEGFLPLSVSRKLWDTTIRCL